MNPLTENQIKVKQLKLLQIKGYNLRDFANNTNNKMIFTISYLRELPQLRKISTKNVWSIRNNANANLQGFAWALFHTIFHKKVTEDILHILKSAILSQQLSTVQILNLEKTCVATLSQTYMKKFLIQFIFQLKYSSLENKIESKLNKNPIVLDIMAILFRKLMVTLHVQNAEDFDKPIRSSEAIQVLEDYFDLNVRHIGNLFLFYEDNIFIHTKSPKDVMFGRYHEYSEQKRSKTEQSDEKQYQDEATIVPKKSNYDNRSLTLMATTQSVIFQPQADTPSFNFDHTQNSFRSSKISSCGNSDESALLKSHFGNDSPIKSNDVRNSMNQSRNNFDSAVISPQRLRLEKQLKESHGIGFQKIMDTPKTAPNIVVSEYFNFEMKNPENDKANKVQMRKHKSLKLDDVDSCSLQNNKTFQQESNSDQQFVLEVVKKTNINLSSNIYDISISIKQRNEPFSSQRFQTRIVSKGLNGQIYCKSPQPSDYPSSSLFNRSEQRIKYIQASPKQLSFKKRNDSKLLLLKNSSNPN